MLLAVNIGNSNMRFAAFRPDGEIISWTLLSKPYRTEDEYVAAFSTMYAPFELKKQDISGIVIGSVVPALTTPVLHSLRKIHQIEPLIVDRDSGSRIKHTSNQMGTDLFANAVAAHEFYEGKKIIIDFGTALTFTGIDENGKTMGVAIAPGIKTALKSLVDETAQLPEIEIKPPEKILGFDTVSCMQSGMVYGFLGMVEGMIDRINRDVNEDCLVIATGGMSYTYAPLSEKISVQDILHTVKGLAVLYELNKK